MSRLFVKEKMPVYLLIAANVVVFAAIVGFALVSILNNEDASELVAFPFEVPAPYLESNRVFQQVSDDSNMFDFAIDDDLRINTLTSCINYGADYDEPFEKGKSELVIWAAGSDIPGGSGVLSITCDVTLDELADMEIGKTKLIDLILTDSVNPSLIEHGFRLSALNEGDSFNVIMKSIHEDTTKKGYDLVLGTVPVTALGANGETQLRWTVPFAFWVESGFFPKKEFAYRNDLWSEIEHTYYPTCLDDGCSETVLQTNLEGS